MKVAIKCEECSGKGEVYLRIAGDVHIAKCAACEGWGFIDTKPPQKDPEWHKHQRMGVINLDDFLGDE